MTAKKTTKTTKVPMGNSSTQQFLDEIREKLRRIHNDILRILENQSYPPAVMVEAPPAPIPTPVDPNLAVDVRMSDGSRVNMTLSEIEILKPKVAEAIEVAHRLGDLYQVYYDQRGNLRVVVGEDTQRELSRHAG